MSNLRERLRCKPAAIFGQLIENINLEIADLGGDLPTGCELSLTESGNEHTLQISMPGHDLIGCYLSVTSTALSVAPAHGNQFQHSKIEVRWDQEREECRLFDGDVSLSVNDLTQRLLETLLQQFLPDSPI